ncbi:MAG: hypothetical protein H6812_04870 [Phycisphaeraceae bacterium]|nr:hypothetical protein [Phycisphaerales bacterium]MCB9842572.1 hypothetical protein [Phycisphaeraceae bacterium]
MPLFDPANLTRLLAEMAPETPEPGELPAAGRAWIVLAIFALLMGLLITLLIITLGRRSYRRYARRHQIDPTPSHIRASAWSEAGKRAAPEAGGADLDDFDPDEFGPDLEPHG